MRFLHHSLVGILPLHRKAPDTKTSDLFGAFSNLEGINTNLAEHFRQMFFCSRRQINSHSIHRYYFDSVLPTVTFRLRAQKFQYNKQKRFFYVCPFFYASLLLDGQLSPNASCTFWLQTPSDKNHKQKWTDALH
jgi:hypothetical protein